MIRSLGMNTVSFSGTNLLEQFKEKQKNVNLTTDEKPRLEGADVLTNYAKAWINQPPSIVNELKPAELVTIKGDEADTLQGEKVLNSNGVLEAIVVKGDSTTKEYHFFADKQLSKIVEKENETGKVLKAVNFGTENNKLTCAGVTEYGANKGDEKYTAFDEGKVSFVLETKFGQHRSVGFNEDGSLRSTSEYDVPSGADKITRYNDGKIESIRYYRDGRIVSKSEYSPDGGEVVQYSKGKMLIPDFDLEKIKAEMAPADINSVKVPENIETIQGEKKFRSNGTLESIEVKGENGKSTEYKVDFEGKKITMGTEIENGKPVKNFGLDEDGSVLLITEMGEKDKTTHFKDGKPHAVTVMADGVQKSIEFRKDGKNLRGYSEWDTKTERDIRTVELDDNDEVISYTKDTPDGYMTTKKGLSD